MAEFFRLSKTGKKDRRAANLSFGSFWEDWIERQLARRPAERTKRKSLNEHGVWEKAVRLSVEGLKS
jgi:hypothetical protein